MNKLIKILVGLNIYNKQKCNRYLHYFVPQLFQFQCTLQSTHICILDNKNMIRFTFFSNRL